MKIACRDFKALKQVVKLLYKLEDYNDMLSSYRYTKILYLSTLFIDKCYANLVKNFLQFADPRCKTAN